MHAIGPRLGYNVDLRRAPSIFGIEGVALNLKVLDPINRRPNKGNVRVGVGVGGAIHHEAIA